MDFFPRVRALNDESCVDRAYSMIRKGV